MARETDGFVQHTQLWPCVSGSYPPRQTSLYLIRARSASGYYTCIPPLCSNHQTRQWPPSQSAPSTHGDGGARAAIFNPRRPRRPRLLYARDSRVMTSTIRLSTGKRLNNGPNTVDCSSFAAYDGGSLAVLPPRQPPRRFSGWATAS
jgi:hypothetical protein